MFVAAIMIPIMCSSYADNQKSVPLPQSSTTLVNYNPANTDATPRRREAGLSEEERRELGDASSTGARGIARGAARGAARGIARGAARGAARGVARGVQRGVARGVQRGMKDEVEKIDIDSKGKSKTVEPLPLPNRLEPLAPSQTGYTSNAQPTIYFYLSDPSSDPIQFVLNRRDQIDPVLTYTIELNPQTGQIAAGIHAIDLSKHPIRLEKNVEYEWFVLIILDQEERSSDFLASATIKYVEDKMKSPSANDIESLKNLAARGLWYDTVQGLNTLIENHPDNAELHQQLQHLLKQVNLFDTARYQEQLIAAMNHD